MRMYRAADRHSLEVLSQGVGGVGAKPSRAQRAKAVLVSGERPLLVRAANLVAICTAIALVVLGAIVLAFFVKGTPGKSASSSSAESTGQAANTTANTTVCARDADGFLTPDDCFGRYAFVAQQLDLSAFRAPSYDVFGLVDWGLVWAQDRLLKALHARSKVKQRDAQFSVTLGQYSIGGALSLRDALVHSRVALFPTFVVPFNATASSDLRTFHLTGSTSTNNATTVVTDIDATARVHTPVFSQSVGVVLRNTATLDLSAQMAASDMRVAKSGDHHVVTAHTLRLSLSFDATSSKSEVVSTDGGCKVLSIDVCSALVPLADELVASQVLNSGALLTMLSDEVVSRLQEGGETSQDLRHWMLECACVLVPGACENKEVADNVHDLVSRTYVRILLLSISLLLVVGLRVTWRVCKHRSRSTSVDDFGVGAFASPEETPRNDWSRWRNTDRRRLLVAPLRQGGKGSKRDQA